MNSKTGKYHLRSPVGISFNPVTTIDTTRDLGREEPRVEWKIKFPGTQDIFPIWKLKCPSNRFRNWTPPAYSVNSMTTSLKATLESGQKQTLASTTDSTSTYHCNGDSRIQFRNQKLHHVDSYSPNELQDRPPERTVASAWSWYTDDSLQNNLRKQQTVYTSDYLRGGEHAGSSPSNRNVT